ncbi:MAG TPA: protein kinase [Thermoanaerobaculia bacterium]|nr:protein kinase [Thermoanaerobaculia bacterium]
MSLETKTRLGPYEIRGALGAGGMGEVYRARDTRLERDVAIKLLSEEVASDRNRLRRFEKEARAASSLNHPNIVTIHSVEESDSASFIVMELVEGKTLRDRLAGGPLPARKLLEIGAQIADGLARAHASGIVHRDLKPENVMVTKEGLVKILDFGLVKLAHPEAGEGQPVEAETVSQITRPGIVMGTVGYMSPEQASGHPVDFHSDQFSLGSILYELATGKQPFKRPTTAQTLAAIIQEEPEPIAAINPKVPPPVRWIVERCLAKEPRIRYASSEDLARELATVRDRLPEFTSGESAVPGLKPSTRRRRQLAAWIAAGLFAAVTLAAVLLWRPKESSLPRRYAELNPPYGTELFQQGVGQGLAVAPDGQRIVYLVYEADGRRRLFLREFAEAESRALPGTEDAHSPFWAPDSRTVGFFSDTPPAPGRLKRVGIADASALDICIASEARGASWGADDTILFGNLKGSLGKVSASGGQPIAVTRPAPGTDHVWPHFLPDGRHFLFLSRSWNPLGPLILRAGSLDSLETEGLGTVHSVVAYAPPGYLLYTAEDWTLVAQPFDLNGLRILGRPFPVVDQPVFHTGPVVSFSASRTGVLAYRVRPAPRLRRFAWFDRSGKELERFGTAKRFLHQALSPDGSRIVYAVPDQRTEAPDLWIDDLSRGTTTRFTSDPSEDIEPCWSPDGSQIAFLSSGKRPRDIFVKSAGGVTPRMPVLESDDFKQLDDWSPDGRFLLYESYVTAGIPSLWVLPMTGERKPFRVTDTPFKELYGQFSPDGHWIAYLSDESGQLEVYVRAFPRATERFQISSGGANLPHWRKDGKELFYVSADTHLMSVAIETAPAFKAGVPRLLFRPGPDTIGKSFPCPSPPCAFFEYEVHPDGQRFLIPLYEREAPKPPITLVFNWTPEKKN